ncbi:MAG: hypothetical protein N2169_07095, partial [bacterium]|nr:hypothetical protein [bacterium]
MFNISIQKNLKAILIPGLVFQSIVTGGGFATGREIVQYCIRHGIAFPWILITILIFFIVLNFLMIETARLFQAFDYRSWGQKIIPKLWIVLDVLFVAMAILVCSIVISGAVEVVQDIIAIPAIVSLFISIVIIVLITAGGKKYVLTTKIFGACFLMLGYLMFLFFSISNFGNSLYHNVHTFGNVHGWWISALEYVGYNTVALPACLYTFQYVKSRKQALLASVFSGFMVIIPMLFVSLSVLS